MVLRYTEKGMRYHEGPYTQDELHEFWRRIGNGPVAFTRPGTAAVPAPDAAVPAPKIEPPPPLPIADQRLREAVADNLPPWIVADDQEDDVWHAPPRFEVLYAADDFIRGLEKVGYKIVTASNACPRAATAAAVRTGMTSMVLRKTAKRANVVPFPQTGTETFRMSCYLRGHKYALDFCFYISADEPVDVRLRNVLLGTEVARILWDAIQHGEEGAELRELRRTLAQEAGQKKKPLLP
jgi:hypothetical protein